MKLLNKGILVALAIMFLFANLSTDAHASQTDRKEILTLTYNDAIDMAEANTHNTTVMDQNIDKLWDAYNAQVSRWNSMNQQLETFTDYEKLYNKKNSGIALDTLEQLQFNIYVSIFGTTPPQISLVDKYNNYIRVGEFPCFQIYASVENLRTQRKLFKSSLAVGIRELFNSIMELHNELKLQMELYDIMVAQNEQMSKKFDAGLLSEFDRYSSDISLEMQKRRVNILTRNIDNLEMSFKSQIGVPLTQKITLTTGNDKLAVALYSSYSSYLRRALENRSEILIAKMNISVRERELETTKEYLKNDKLTEVIDAQIAFDEMNTELDNAINAVTVDITNGYKDVVSKHNSIRLAISNNNNALKQYNNAEQLYQKGLISHMDFLNYKSALNQAKIDYINAVYQYNNAVNKLDSASGIGPGYSSQGGIQ